MAYGEQKIKLPPGASLIEEDEVKLPEGATLISDDASKKKASTVSFGETYSSPELDSETPSTSEIPTVVDYGDGEPLPNNIVDLSRKATEYSKKTKEIERTDMRGNPIPETVPDESFIGTSKKIIEDLDKQGIKKDFVDVVSDLPDEAFNDPNTSKDKLVELYKTNRIKFHQFVNEQKNRIAIKKAAFENQRNANNGIDDIDPTQMAVHVANKYLGTYEEAHPQNLDQLQDIILKKQDIIGQSLIGEERTKALERVRESYSSYINPTNPDIQAEYEQSPLKGKVDVTQYSALKTLQLFDAKKYEQAVNILNTDIQKQYTFKPEFENFQSPVAASTSVTTSDSTLAAKNKGSLSSETIDQQIGKESILRQLTELGRNNLVTQINSQQYDLEQSFNNTDNPEEKEAIKQQYVLNQGKLDEVSKNASQDNIKFPLTSKLEFDNQVKELVQDAGMGAVEYGTNKFAHGVGVGGESFEDMAVSIFGSEKDKALLGMKRMGESKWFESKTYLPEDYRSTNSPFIMQPSEALKDAAKGITGGKKLSDLSADQKQQLTELVANNQSQIETVTNPKAGKSKNFFSKATLYSNTGFIGEVGAFMYKIMGAKSLGLSGKSAELLTLYNDGYSASYTEKLKEGASAEEANQYGVLHGGVMLLAGTVSSKFDAVKDMLAASKSPISKQILGLGEAGWDAIVNKNKSTISKIANGVSDVVKSNAKMIGTYGVGVSIASDLADKGFFNKDISVSEMADNVKHSAIDMAIGSVGLAGIGFISHAIKNPVTLKDKATIWEIGDNKEFSKQRIDEAVAKNELTQAEGDAKKKVIDNVASLIDKVPTENSKGKLLTDNEKVKLLYNLILKEKGKEAAKDLPDNQSDKAEHIALVADYANGIILENPTDKQLESRKNTLEKQIEGKDENGKPLLPEKELLKAKAQLEAVNNAIEHKQSFDQSVKLEKRDFRKPQGNPEEISQPIELKVEPTVKEEAPTVSDKGAGERTFITHNKEVVSGKKLTDAINKVADNMVENANKKRQEHYASHITEKQKDDFLSKDLKYAEEVREGKHLDNFTIWQRINTELTGETPPLLPKEQSKPQPTNEAKAPEVQQSTEVKEPTITEPNKVGEEAETATEEQVKKLITDAAINKKGERAKQLAMEEEAAKHGELGQKVLDDMNGGKEPPIETKEVTNDGSEDWASVRKEKLKEISGVKEMMEKRKPKGWTQTFQSAAENVQKMFPKKSLYEAMKARVNQLKLKLESGELYNPTSEDNAVFTMLRAETNKRISEVEGQDSSNPVERLAANIELENLHNDLMDIARVTNPEGEAGRAFNILQSEAKFDENNGLKIRRMELMKAKGGEPLTPEENKWAESQWEKEKEIMRQEHEAKVKGMQEDFDAKIDELQKEYDDKLKETGKGKSATTKDKTLSQKGKDIADQIRKLKIQKGDTAVDVTMGLRNLAIEAVATLVEKGATIAEAIKKVLEDDKYKGLTGDELTNHIIDGLKNKKDKTEELSKIEKFAEENDVTDITKDMVEKNLIRDYVNSHIGEVEQKDILNTAFKDLKEVLPSITKERMLEAYLKENEFKQPTKKALEGSITEAKKELASIAKLEEDIQDLEGLKEVRQRSFPTEREKSEHEQKLFDEKNAKVKEITDRNNKIKSDNARIEAERNRQLKKVDELRTKKEKLEKGIIEKTEARDRKLDTPEIEKLRNEVKQIEKDIRSAEAAQRAAERKVISDRNKSIKEGNRKVESEAIRQVSKVQELQAKKEALENGIREKRDVIKKVDTPEIEAMKKAVKEADDNLRAAEVEARRMAKEIQDKKDKIGELDANIERAKNDRDLIKTHKDKSVREIDEEISNKQKELKKAIKDNSSDERVQAKKLEDAKKNVIKQKDEFQRKLDEGEFEEPEPIKLKKKDAELIRLEKEKSIIEEAYRKKQKEFQEKNKHWAERAMDTIRSSYVALLIGSPVTLAKVGFMSLVRPLSEGIRKATLGKVFDSFFPNISKAALRGGESSSISSIKKGYEAYFRNIGEAKLEEKYQKAENELRVAAKEYNDYKNSSNPDAKKLEQLKNKMNDKLIKSTGSFIYKFIGSSSIKDAWTALVNRSNEIEKQFGKVESESFKDGNWLDKSNYVAGFIGRSHSAAKTFSGRFSFAAGFMARLEGAVKNGEDITKGDKILEIAHESYLDWERGKYQQSNAISDIWNKITNSISKGEEKGIRTTTAKAMEALLKGDVAITRVPVNILHESVVEYTFGAIKAAYMGGKEYLKARKDVKESGIMPNEVEFKDALRQRISQMDEKQAATIVRCFTKGGVGIGLYALALISGGVQFGILPHLGQKKKKDEKDLKKGEMNPGDIIIGDTRMNHTFAKLVEHVPALYPTAMGLGMAQAYKDEIDKGKTTKEAVAKSLFTHLQIIEGSVPQTQILSPSRVSKKMYDIGEKRLEEMGVVNTDEKSIFTKDEQENATIKTLKERGIELKQPSQSHHKIDVDEKHPNGLMMPDEWEKFQKIRKDVILKGIPKSKDQDAIEGLDDIMKAHYKVVEKSKWGRVKSKIVQGKDLTDEQLKSKVQSLQEKATEYANDKLGLKKKKDTTTTIKKIR